MITPRKQWGGPDQPIGARTTGPATSVTVHHPYPHHTAAGAAITQELREVKAIHDFHVNGNGWAGIGYNFIITQNGHIIEGRGFGRVGAHAGTTTGNRTSIGVAFLIDGYKQKPTQAAADAFETLRADAIRGGYLIEQHTLKLHSDWKATDCPGPVLAAWVRRPPPAAAPRMLKFGMKGEDVRAVQLALNVAPATGYFGPLTDAAVKELQRKHGLAADGIVGPMTRGKLR